MDLRAFYIQAAEAAAVRAADGDGPKNSPKAVLLQIEVQGVGLGGADGTAPVALPPHGKSLSGGGHGNGAGTPVVGVDGDRTCEGGGAARDLTCPECGKVFLSDKAMYGHLRCHPERGYKGATRPATPAAASVAGDTKTRKVPRKEADLSTKSPAAAAAAVDAGGRKPRNVPWEVAELSARWPVTARRGRTPTTANNAVSAAAPAAVLESACSEEEEAAMILLKMSSRGATPEPEELPTRQMHVRNAVVDAGQQMPGVEQLELPDHVTDGDVATHLAPEVEQPVIPEHAVALQQAWEAEKPAQVEHIFKIVMEPQAPEAEQALRQQEHVAEVIAASEAKNPTKLEPVTEAVLVVLRDKKGKPVSHGAKKPKKRRLHDHDLDQTPDSQPPEAADVKPPARRIPSPASNRTYVCPTCHKTFPSHQALGGHMASHNRVSKYSGANQHIDGLAVAHAVHNIMARHHHHQGGSASVAIAAASGLGEERLDIPPPPPPVAPQGPAQHPCSQCHLIFPTGQALGGHMRKHWLADKLQSAAAVAAEASGVAPRDFDLNELPRE